MSGAGDGVPVSCVAGSGFAVAVACKGVGDCAGDVLSGTGDGVSVSCVAGSGFAVAVTCMGAGNCAGDVLSGAGDGVSVLCVAESDFAVLGWLSAVFGWPDCVTINAGSGSESLSPEQAARMVNPAMAIKVAIESLM